MCIFPKLKPFLKTQNAFTNWSVQVQVQMANRCLQLLVIEICENMWTNQSIGIIWLEMDCNWYLKHVNKSKYWRYLVRDRGDFCNFIHFDKLMFWSEINWSIDVSNFCNFIHLDILKFWSALNWPIDVGIFYNCWQYDKLKFFNIINFSIDEVKSFNRQESNKLKSWNALN